MIATMIEIPSLLVIMWFSLCSLNHMSKDTAFAIFLGLSLLFAGSSAMVFAISSGVTKADPASAVVYMGIAIGMLSNRRNDFKCPCAVSWFGNREDK